MTIEKINGFIIIEKDGLKRTIDWNSTTRLVWPEMLDILLDYDMGIGEDPVHGQELRQAAREYGVRLITGFNKLVESLGREGYTAGEMASLLWAFIDGFRTARGWVSQLLRREKC